MLLTWDQPADSTIIKYQVSRNGGTTFADFPYSSKAANGYNFTGLTNGTEYTFALRAVNADGIGPHATVMATPAAYGGVGLDPATAITADLTVYYDGPGGTRTGTITLSSVTSGEVTNLRILGTISPPDCWYIAWTTDVVGEIRAWVFAVHLTTTGVNTDNVPLIWRAAPERLSPDTSPDVGLDHYISLTWNRAADSTIGWYEYRQKAGSGAFGPWTVIRPEIDGTSNYYNVLDLARGIRYTFELRAVGSGVVGQTSKTGATLLRPAMPQGLTSKSEEDMVVGESSVVLSWDDPGDPSNTGWMVIYRQCSTDAAPTHTFDGLTNDFVSEFEVQGVNASGHGPAASVMFRTEQETRSPDAPTGVTAAGGDQQVTLTWNDLENPSITHFEYRQSDSEDNDGNASWGAWTIIVGSRATTTSHTITGLTNGTEYAFELRAVNTSGDGVAAPLTGTITATPESGFPHDPPRNLRASFGNQQVTLSWHDPSDGDIEGYEYRLSNDGGVNWGLGWRWYQAAITRPPRTWSPRLGTTPATPSSCAR